MQHAGSFFLKGLNFPVISLSPPSSLLGLRSLRAPQNPICSPYHRIFCWGLSEGEMLMMRLGVFSRGQTVKGLFNHVKRLGLYPTGSQDSGKGLKPLKHHHLSDRQGRVLTGKWEGWAGETGKQIHRLGEASNNGCLLADDAGALHSLLGFPLLTSCASWLSSRGQLSGCWSLELARHPRQPEVSGSSPITVWLLGGTVWKPSSTLELGHLTLQSSPAGSG